MGACSGFNGERKTAGAREMTTKAALVEAIKAAGAECGESLRRHDRPDGHPDDHRDRAAAAAGWARYGNVVHIEHEYAQMAVHFRLKGLVPPSSERR